MKYVYSFKDGNKNMRDSLGGKGANLCEMTNIGLPVPSGFIVSTKACLRYYEDNFTINDKILSEIDNHIKELEKESSKNFGDPNKPLLVSVRSGARVSMPGMMDTVLNLGLNDEIIKNIKDNNRKKFMLDCYRRLITMYSDVVKGFDKEEFESILETFKKDRNIEYDYELSLEDLNKLVFLYKAKYHALEGSSFPLNPKVQLKEAIMAVFRSWNSKRAIEYRKLNDISDDWGTAVNVEEMIYGNYNDNSLTGVIFSRNPATGEDKLYGEYMINAQGEDIVAGIRTPKNIDELEKEMPDIYAKLVKYSKKLEKHYKDMQDMEFTVQDGKLYMLQTRNGKRAANAAIKIAADMYEEKLISKEELPYKISNKDLESVLHKTFDRKELSSKEVLCKGIPASPGAGSGKVYFTSLEAKKASETGEKDIILIRKETSAEDINGMSVASAVITNRGGMTSHAAVVARGMGVPCVSGCENLDIDEDNKIVKINNYIIKSGDYLSVDGTTGTVYIGKINTTDKEPSSDFIRLIKHLKNIGNVKVRSNAETEHDAITARNFGATGLGLCRTEHMFFDEKRIKDMRKMILSESKEERKLYLDRLKRYQKEDFIKLFKVMDGFPITIRLLDPPLHEFLPKNENEIIKLAVEESISKIKIEKRIEELKEYNPMMGHRGIRLGISYPEIIKMQAEAIFEALIEAENNGVNAKLEIMIPLVSTIEEFQYAKNIIDNTYEKITNRLEKDYMIGTKIGRAHV